MAAGECPNLLYTRYSLLSGEGRGGGMQLFQIAYVSQGAVDYSTVLTSVPKG